MSMLISRPIVPDKPKEEKPVKSAAKDAKPKPKKTPKK